MILEYGMRNCVTLRSAPVMILEYDMRNVVIQHERSAPVMILEYDMRIGVTDQSHFSYGQFLYATKFIRS